MGISKYNSEGYYDPVPQMAVNEIEKELHKWRPLVYICSPFSGDIEGNTQRARAYSRFAVDQGAVPLELQFDPETWRDDAEGKRLRYEAYAKRFLEQFLEVA